MGLLNKVFMGVLTANVIGGFTIDKQVLNPFNPKNDNIVVHLRERKARKEFKERAQYRNSFHRPEHRELTFFEMYAPQYLDGRHYLPVFETHQEKEDFIELAILHNQFLYFYENGDEDMMYCDDDGVGIRCGSPQHLQALETLRSRLDEYFPVVGEQEEFRVVDPERFVEQEACGTENAEYRGVCGPHFR